MGENGPAVVEDEPAARALTERTRAVARLLVADIERLCDEYPRYDRDVVAGLFKSLYAASGHVPTYRDARARMELYSETMTNAKLRRFFVTSRDRASRSAGGAKQGSDPTPAHAPARRGRPPGRTTTIRDDTAYRYRWERYLRSCDQQQESPTLTGFSTWTGVDVTSGSHWPRSTIKDYRRSASKRGVDLPPTR